MAKIAVQEQEGHWPVPEGTILAPLWKRISAYVLDSAVVMGVLVIATRSWVAYAWNFGVFEFRMVFCRPQLVADHSDELSVPQIHGQHIGRSLGQRWFGLAVVREDGEPLHRSDCGRRAISKLRYLIPVVNLYFLYKDGQFIRKRHTHQSSIDLACASIVVVANSLPPAKRSHLR